jgi:formyltetrahydrofolate deformylase
MACVYEDEADRNKLNLAAKKYSFDLFKISSREELRIVLEDLSPLDIGVLANFGMILRPEHLRIPIKGFINIHPGLLPENPGRNPVRKALDSKDAMTGISIHRATVDVDRGPILRILKHQIHYPATPEVLMNILFAEASSQLPEILNLL